LHCVIPVSTYFDPKLKDLPPLTRIAADPAAVLSLYFRCYLQWNGAAR